jgi:hypothetical protein
VCPLNQIYVKNSSDFAASTARENNTSAPARGMEAIKAFPRSHDWWVPGPTHLVASVSGSTQIGVAVTQRDGSVYRISYFRSA